MTTTPVPSQQVGREEEVLERVLRSFDGCDDARRQELAQFAVKHLHAFVREVRLTEHEWMEGIEFLTAIGQMTDDKRQEFILLSDTLGVSMQVITVNNSAHHDATEATVLGPFFVEGSPEVANGGDISFGAAGQPCWIEGRVTDSLGRPVPGAKVEVWEADDDGLYDVQHGDERTAARGHLITGGDGRYRFWAILPTPYPIPSDGPVGRMLAATGRSPMRAAHLHFMVQALHCRTLVTHIFVAGDPLLASDSVFGVRDSLVKTFVEHPAGVTAPDGRIVDGPWSRVDFDIVLAPAGV